MTLNSFQKAALKRNAQNVYQYLTREDKIQAQISQLQEELQAVREIIESLDTPTRNITGGYGTRDIIKRVIEDKTTVTGKEYKITKYEFLYPETIIPIENTTPDNYSEGVSEEAIQLNINL